MKSKRLLSIIGEIDDRYIAQAAPGSENHASRSRIRWAALAACLCIAAAGILLLPKLRKQQTPVPDPGASEVLLLDPITVPELIGEGMGFESYLCYDVSELTGGNPWSESMQLSVLPVYRNGAYDPSGAGIPTGLSTEAMTERLAQTADALHLHILSTEVIEKNGTPAPGEAPTGIRAKTNRGVLSVLADGSITYTLPDSGAALPDGFRFTLDSTSESEAQAVLSYLLASYADLLSCPEPMPFTWGDYTFYGKFHRRYCAYNASGDDPEKIVQYNLQTLSFIPNESGNLGVVQIGDSLLSAEKLGDYPIVTAEEAKARLLAGYYQTSVPAAFPGEEYLENVELVYRTGRREELLLPYYRFYVLLPDDLMEVHAEGLKCCGAYYVPAIADAYLTGLPVYDGSFN